MMTPRRHAPATARNREPILDVLRRVLPQQGLVLEISAGSGEHAAFFSAAHPDLDWQPSDLDPEALESIDAWRSEGSERLHSAIRLDTTEDPWPVPHADAIVNINMIHIAPWAACQGLMRGAGRILPPGGVLFMYGPYKLEGRHTAPSNEAFDESLRGRNPSWGVRDLDEVIAEASANGLDFIERIAMPANNQSVVYRRR